MAASAAFVVPVFNRKQAVNQLARDLGVADGFRVIINNGEEGGQTVFHLHMHLLGNKEFDESQLGF